MLPGQFSCKLTGLVQVRSPIVRDDVKKDTQIGYIPLSVINLKI